jgi:hypothetical protein
MERPMTPIPTQPILLMIPPELIQDKCQVPKQNRRPAQGGRGPAKRKTQ